MKLNWIHTKNYKYWTNKKTGWQKLISIVKDTCIPNATDDEAKVFNLKMIENYYKYITKTGGWNNSKIQRIWSNFDLKWIKKHLLFTFETF